MTPIRRYKIIYQYKCTNCQTLFDIVQDINEKHTYRCPICDQVCIREWTVPSVSVSEVGFFSASLGKYVKDYKEFDKELDRTRYMTRMEKHLRRDQGYNRAPEQEWVDAREKKESESKQKADRDWEESRAWLKKVGKTNE